MCAQFGFGFITTKSFIPYLYFAFYILSWGEKVSATPPPPIAIPASRRIFFAMVGLGPIVV